MLRNEINKAGIFTYFKILKVARTELFSRVGLVPVSINRN